MKALRIAGIVLVVSFVGLFLWAKYDNWKSQSHVAQVSAPQNFPIEQKFVIVSVGHFVPFEDESVARAKTLIDRAAETYRMPKDLAADQAYTAYTVAQKDGIKTTPMEVLEAATLAYVPDSGVDFAKSCAMYITLRKSGMPHAEAIVGMKGLVTKITDMGDVSRR